MSLVLKTTPLLFTTLSILQQTILQVYIWCTLFLNLLTPSLPLDHMVKLITAKRCLAELEKELQDNEHINLHLNHINTHLYNAVVVCRAARREPEVPTFNQQLVIPPSKIPEHQWRFTRTTLTPGRKRHGNRLV